MNAQKLSGMVVIAVLITISSYLPGEGPLKNVAGSYYFGDGLGVNCSLVVQAEGRFSFRWSGCLGTYDQHEGPALLKEGHLILKPEKPNIREVFQGTPTDFVAVRWERRLYLVPAARGKDFCGQVNQGGEPRQSARGFAYLRDDDWTKAVTGLPNVPKDWEPFLLKKPLRGHVVEVLNGGKAKVDFGRADGAFEDMELWADVPGFGFVTVIKVEERSCTIAIKYPGRDGIAFEKGQKVGSKLVGKE